MTEARSSSHSHIPDTAGTGVPLAPDVPPSALDRAGQLGREGGGERREGERGGRGSIYNIYMHVHWVIV